MGVSCSQRVETSLFISRNSDWAKEYSITKQVEDLHPSAFFEPLRRVFLKILSCINSVLSYCLLLRGFEHQQASADNIHGAYHFFHYNSLTEIHKKKMLGINP